MAFDFDSYLNYAMGRESSGNPSAKNPMSSASGLFQFIDSTYLPYARAQNPGVSESALLAKKNDPAMQTAVMRAFTQDNLSKLQENGIEPSNGSAYLSHFLGSQGALKALLANPNTPIENVVNPAAIKSNPHVFRNVRTAGDLATWAQGGADKPVQGGTPVANTAPANTPGGYSVPPAPSAPTEPPSMLDQLKGGGPGALFGMGQPGWNMGETLQGVGAAMMARDDPKAAAALAQLMANQTKQRDKPNIDTHYDPKSGLMYQVDKHSGRVAVRSMGERQGPDDSIRKSFDANDKTVDYLSNVVKEGREIQKALKDGTLAIDPVSRAVTWGENLMGKTSEQTKWQARLDAFTEKLRNATLQAANGVQTEGDAVRALNQIFPAGSSYSSGTAVSQLDNILATSENDIRGLSDKNRSVLKENEGSRFSSTRDGSRYDKVMKDLEDHKTKFNTPTGSLPKPDQDGAIRFNGVVIRPRAN